MTTVLNGWDVDMMNEAVNRVRRQPEAGKLTWRSRANWDGGFGLDVRTAEIEQLGCRIRRHFTFRGDHPPELLGQNTGPTAIETMLAALGSCMTGAFAAQATAHGVELRSLEVDLEADIDLNGFFGLQPIRPGLSNVTVSFSVNSEADRASLNAILEAASALSPIFDTVTKPVAVETRLNTTAAEA